MPLQQDWSVTRTVIDAVAAREGVSPTDIDDPLYEVIDPDALDTLFTGATGRVVFEYHGYRVTVHSDRTVELDPLGP